MKNKLVAYILLCIQIILGFLFFAPFIGGEMPLKGTVGYCFYDLASIKTLQYYTIFLLQLVNFVLLLAIIYRSYSDIKARFLTFILPVNYLITAFGCFFAKYAFLTDNGKPIFDTLWGAKVCGIISLILFVFSLVLIDLQIQIEKNNYYKEIKKQSIEKKIINSENINIQMDTKNNSIEETKNNLIEETKTIKPKVKKDTRPVSEQINELNQKLKNKEISKYEYDLMLQEIFNK